MARKEALGPPTGIEVDWREHLALARGELDLLREVEARVLKALTDSTLATNLALWEIIGEVAVRAELATIREIVNPAKEGLGLPIDDLNRDIDATKKFVSEARKLGIPRSVAEAYITARIEVNKAEQRKLRGEFSPEVS